MFLKIKKVLRIFVEKHFCHYSEKLNIFYFEKKKLNDHTTKNNFFYFLDKN